MTLSELLLIFGLVTLACAALVLPFLFRSRSVDPVVSRIERALAEAVSAARGGPMETVFAESTAARIGSEVRTVAQRLSALDAQDLSRRLADIQKSEQSASTERAAATARLHRESLERLAAMREADARALLELAELLEALRAQLLLARLAGSSAIGTSGASAEIVSEVWARVQGLSATMDP